MELKKPYHVNRRPKSSRPTRPLKTATQRVSTAPVTNIDFEK